jgi:hypothetical protein
MDDEEEDELLEEPTADQLNEIIFKRFSLLYLQRRLFRGQLLRQQIPAMEKQLRNLEGALGRLADCPRRKGAIKRKIKTHNEKLNACRIELREIIRRNHYLSSEQLIQVEDNHPMNCERQPLQVFDYEGGEDAVEDEAGDLQVEGPDPGLDEVADAREGGVQEVQGVNEPPPIDGDLREEELFMVDDEFVHAFPANVIENNGLPGEEEQEDEE